MTATTQESAAPAQVKPAASPAMRPGVRPRRPGRRPRLRAHLRLPPQPGRRVRLRRADPAVRAQEGRPDRGRRRAPSRAAANGTGRGKFRPLLRVDTVNGMPPELAAARPHFDDLTPLYPQQRLRLEDGNPSATARIIDLVAPIGKGQRGLIVSPPKAGKTMVLQAIAAAIANSHPEVKLMVVLVGERPEEVTDLRRSVRGEVIFSTFDQAADDHIRVAELAIERAKRLVETGRRRGRAARFHHPAGPGLQPGRAGQQPDPRGRGRGLRPAAAAPVPRRRPQRRRRRLAHHLVHRAGGHRLPAGRRAVRGVQGHRQHGAAAPPRAGREAHLPGDRRDAVRHPPRRAADGPGRIPGRRHRCAARSAPSTPSRPSNCSWTRPGTPPPTPSSSARSSGPVRPPRDSARPRLRPRPRSWTPSGQPDGTRRATRWTCKCTRTAGRRCGAACARPGRGRGCC